MKQFKTVLLIVAIVCSTLSYAQTNDSIPSTFNFFKSLNFGLNTTNYNFNFKKIALKKNLSFSSYNPITKLNDTYLIIDGEYSYSKSNFLFENNFRAQKIDSYNPYGASNMSTALLLGTVGEFLNKIQD